MKIEEPNTPYNHEYVESQETKPEAVEDDGTVTKYYEKARIKCFIEVQRVLIEKKSPLVKSKGISIEVRPHILFTTTKNKMTMI